MDLQLSKPIAVIAEIHDNVDALMAVLADIQTHDVTTILHLGDHLSGPFAAAETADALLAIPMVNIRGNHDRYLTDLARDDMGPSDPVAFDQLSQTHLDWLRDLSAPRWVTDDIFMCHGTPDNNETFWLETVLPTGAVTLRDRAEIETTCADISCGLILCAHTHTPCAVRVGTQLTINPSSVVLPAYDDTRPCIM